ncbi:MAG: hypothetical protein JNL75_11685 [Chitinophagales bacterium]|nr:hypothetical protein [Chitinophagales bacterium]
MKKNLAIIITVLFIQVTSAQNPNTCCPPIIKDDIYQNLFKTEQNPGNILSPYYLTFKPTNAFKNKLSAYVKYLMQLCPGKKFVVTYEVFKVNAPGIPPSNPKYVCTEWYIFQTGNEAIGDVQFGSNAYCVAAEANPSLQGKWFQVGETYCFKVSVASEPSPNCFSNNCQPGLFWVKFNNPVSGIAKNSSGAGVPKFEVYDESGLKLSK